MAAPPPRTSLTTQADAVLLAASKPDALARVHNLRGSHAALLRDQLTDAHATLRRLVREEAEAASTPHTRRP